jgi:YidC/Oxa1 family membrane protein insertase
MEFIAKPFGWLMLRLFELFGNYGVAVIMFALIVKIILLPFQAKSKRSMMQQSRLQPRLKELEKKHGANKAKYQEEVAKMYREEKINPMSGCIWSLIPLPILLALFQAISRPLTIMMGVPKALLTEGGAIFTKLLETGGPTAGERYLEIAQAQHITTHFDSFAGITNSLSRLDYGFLGLNLGNTPQWNFLWTTNWGDPKIWVPGLLLFLIPIASGVLAFLQSKISMSINKQPDQQQSSMKSMMLMMPLISVYFAFIMPGAIGIYIIASSLFAMIQDIYLTKRYTKIMEIEDAARLETQRVREAELEAKRLETERKKAENKTEVNPNTSKKKQQKAERLEQLEKAAEWEKKTAPAAAEKGEDPSRVGTRRYARGRAYDPTRYSADAETADQNEPDEKDVTEVAALPEDEFETVTTEEAAEELDETVEEVESVVDEDEEDK